jgi:hypothetical protein
MESQQILAEMDHGLRYATENPDEWFGGLIMIFSGDFYQFPPIGGHPLYTPIRHSVKVTNNELQQRLGRLAWRSITDVVELTEQKRMESDPQYAEAVGRLRIHQCNNDDIILFNSRCIQSSLRPSGVNMSTSGNGHATAIVHTNVVRGAINLYKAKSTCSDMNALIMAAAHDTVKGVDVPHPFCMQLLNQDVSSFTSKGSLPGFIPLYIGMPVILRSRNISQELHITNGSQGIVRKIEVAKTSALHGYG